MRPKGLLHPLNLRSGWNSDADPACTGSASVFVNGLLRRQLAVAVVVSIAISIVIETEHIKEITNGRAVERNIRVLVLNPGIGEIVPAAGGEGP